MKTINITFEDKEHVALKKLKGKLSWRAFLVLMGAYCSDELKKGNLKMLNLVREKDE